MNPTPQSMLPPQAVASMIRSGGSPGQLFQQNPLSQNMTPDAMGADPTLMQQPQGAGQNPTMPQTPTAPQSTGQPMMPGQQDQNGGQISEAQYILNVLADRLNHHSKITQKTVNTLSDMITAGLPVPGEPGQDAQTA